MCKVKGSAALVIAAAAMIMFLTGCETTKHAEVMSAEELAAQAQASGSEGIDVGPAREQEGIPLDGQGMSEGSLSVGDGSGSGASSGSDIDGAGSSEMPAMSLSSINPEGPPSPTLRGVDGSTMGSDISGVQSVGGSDGGTGGSGQFGDNDLTDYSAQHPTGNRSPAGNYGTEQPPKAYLRDGSDPYTDYSSGSGDGSMGSGGSGMTGSAGSTGGMTESTIDAGPHGYEGQQFVRALAPSDLVPEGPPSPNLNNDGGAAASGSGMDTSESSGSGDEVVSLPDDGESMEPLGQSDFGGSSDGQEDAGDALGHVYFDFDQYVIRNEAVSTLQENVKLLNDKYKDSSVLIEGHCDERGTSNYNLVLGERRAQAVKNYMVDLGVSPSRIHIVSYGKERPICTQSEESCWQQNRRGQVVLQ